MKQISVIAVIGLLVAGACLIAQEKLGPPIKVVDPGGPGKAPSDAVVLFDGHDLSQWTRDDGSPARWAVENGQMVCKTGTGDIYSKAKFKDAQIHVEFNTPNMPSAHGQARANSGVYIQGRYEIQVLDSYNNPTYFAGSAGSVYGQHDPLVNVSRPPGEWQTYDIIYHAPKCSGEQITTPARVTILQNGVLIQDDATVSGPTGGGEKEHLCDAGPLRLQDHFHPDVKETFMRFRNVWFRPL
jgi:hypothetical protein